MPLYLQNQIFLSTGTTTLNNKNSVASFDKLLNNGVCCSRSLVILCVTLVPYYFEYNLSLYSNTYRIISFSTVLYR